MDFRITSHDADGSVVSGDVSELADAFVRGAEVKVAIRGLCVEVPSRFATVRNALARE